MLHLFNLLGMRFGVDAAWRALSVWLPLVALVAGLLLGAWLGRAPLHTALAELRANHTDTLRLAQQAGAKRVQDAQERSDTLALQLSDTLTQTETLKQEKTHALRAAAAGRVCLDARTLGVLNTSPGLSVAGFDGVPTAQPGLVAAGAAFGSDSYPTESAGAPGLVATDADIGTWAIGAGAAYEACRQRLDALIDWHAGPTP